jgi:hypothetical protein
MQQAVHQWTVIGRVATVSSKVPVAAAAAAAAQQTVAGQHTMYEGLTQIPACILNVPAGAAAAERAAAAARAVRCAAAGAD